MPRPQFSVRALLVAMLVVAAFFGGMAVQRKIDERSTIYVRVKRGPDGEEDYYFVRPIPENK